MNDGQRYTSYLLRVWLAGDTDLPHWCASLEDTHTGVRKGFTSLEALYKYLHQQTGLKYEQGNNPKEVKYQDTYR